MDSNTLMWDIAKRAEDSSSGDDRPSYFKIVGISLAIASGLFIGVSFVLKKIGLLKANVKYNEEAGEGYGYLRNLYWWSGMTLMIVGEICNFVAYAFVDAILVTPLGALSVVVTTILSAIFLKERLSFVGKIGCFNCIIGSVVIVLNAPEQSAVSDIQEMQDLVVTPGFLTYTGVIIVGCAVVAFYVAPRWGKKSMMVYLTICSLIGGLSVVSTQGLGASIIAQINGKSQFDQPFLYILLVFVIGTLLTEIIYLNKALNIFNAALVTPTYYVFFTSATIVTSAILFQGFAGSVFIIITVVLGFLQICSGVVLLQLSKSSKDVPDAAVFKGDLDQVRTVAEQEEPEYEPRADTIRGSGALLRSLSKQRDKRQTMEARRLHEERMAPIGENETVEWDGLRRRTTILGSQNSGQNSERITMWPMRNESGRKSSHPPLGMSSFPEEDSDHSDNESTHPGFFTRMKSRSKHNIIPSPMRREHDRATAEAHLSGDKAPPTPSVAPQSAPARQSEYNFEKSGGIHWADESGRSLTKQNPSTLHPPPPPPHAGRSPPGSAKRQFSFNNMFKRQQSDEGHRITQDPTSGAPQLQPGRSKNWRDKHASEEERAGLVTGDTPAQARGSDDSSSDGASPPLGPQVQPTSTFNQRGGGSGELTNQPPPYNQAQSWLVPRLPPLDSEGERMDEDFEDEKGDQGQGWRRKDYQDDGKGGKFL